jgi:hypothetical protein
VISSYLFLLLLGSGEEDGQDYVPQVHASDLRTRRISRDWLWDNDEQIVVEHHTVEA